MVFDGGRASASAKRRIGTSATVAFVPVAELAEHAAPAEVRRVHAALAARADGRTTYLEAGVEPAIPAAMRRFGISPWVHSGSSWVWHGGAVPDDLRIKQAWVWVFAPDGRVVVYLDTNGQVGLPGGTLEPFEHRDPVAAAVREVREETQIDVTAPVHLGYVRDDRPGREPVARVRMAAAIDRIGPSAVDPATGTVHRRLLVPPRLIAELCGWGAGAAGQTAAALAAARDLGITEPDPATPITEIPADGTLPGVGHQ